MVSASEWQAGAILYQMEVVPLAIAHRGDPIAATENTLTAFMSAVRKGADMVELDLRRTRDGAIVVLHDPTLTRLWGLERNVTDLDLSVIQDLSDGCDHIPTLHEVLDQVHIPLMVDFTGRDVIEEALTVTRSAAAMERCLFVSGHIEALRRLRELAPEARIGLTWVKDDPPPVALLHGLGVEYWNPKFTLITPQRVAARARPGLQGLHMDR